MWTSKGHKILQVGKFKEDKVLPSKRRADSRGLFAKNGSPLGTTRDQDLAPGSLGPIMKILTCFECRHTLGTVLSTFEHHFISLSWQSYKLTMLAEAGLGK